MTAIFLIFYIAFFHIASVYSDAIVALATTANAILLFVTWRNQHIFNRQQINFNSKQEDKENLRLFENTFFEMQRHLKEKSNCSDFIYRLVIDRSYNAFESLVGVQKVSFDNQKLLEEYVIELKNIFKVWDLDLHSYDIIDFENQEKFNDIKKQFETASEKINTEEGTSYSDSKVREDIFNKFTIFSYSISHKAFGIGTSEDISPEDKINLSITYLFSRHSKLFDHLSYIESILLLIHQQKLQKEMIQFYCNLLYQALMPTERLLFYYFCFTDNQLLKIIKDTSFFEKMSVDSLMSKNHYIKDKVKLSTRKDLFKHFYEKYQK